MNSLKIIIVTLLALNISKSNAQCFKEIKSGRYHNATLKANGLSWVWGAGLTGALGNGMENLEYSPISLSNEISSKIACGAFDTFIIKTNGTLWGTGYNYAGELGVNSTTEGILNLTQVGTASDWKDIAPGDFFTIALKTDNTIWAWGQNDGYQMGDGSCCANRLEPAQVGTDSDWKSIGISQARSAFAIKNNGTLWCWGSNIAGLLGSNFVSGYPYPTQHNTDTDWASVTLGYAHMLALKTNGTLWAWGSDGQGQTANDGTFGYYDPHQIGTSTWKMVAGGLNTSFGIKTDGTLWAWGQNDAGQLGIGGITPNQFAPVQIGTDNNWDKISAGFEHCIALKTDGSLWAWGDNTFGQYGNGTTINSTTPILIAVSGCTLSNPTFSTGEKFSIAPNPVNKILTINNKENSIGKIIVMNVLGEKIIEKLSIDTILDVEMLQNGIYILQIISDGLPYNYKFIKE